MDSQCASEFRPRRSALIGSDGAAVKVHEELLRGIRGPSFIVEGAAGLIDEVADGDEGDVAFFGFARDVCSFAFDNGEFLLSIFVNGSADDAGRAGSGKRFPCGLEVVEDGDFHAVACAEPAGTLHEFLDAEVRSFACDVSESRDFFLVRVEFYYGAAACAGDDDVGEFELCDSAKGEVACLTGVSIGFAGRSGVPVEAGVVLGVVVESPACSRRDIWEAGGDHSTIRWGDLECGKVIPGTMPGEGVCHRCSSRSFERR